MENCIFCKIGKKDTPCVKVWEDEKYLAFLDMNPINPGHTLLIPKKHTDYLFDLNDDEYCELMLRAKKVAKLLKFKLNPKKVGMVVEGLAVSHAHVHLVPLNTGNLLNPNTGRPPVKTEELERVAKIILS